MSTDYEVTILGGTGQLGQALAQRCEQKGIPTQVTTRDAGAYRQTFQKWSQVHLTQVEHYDALTLKQICENTGALINLIQISREARRSRIDFPPERRGDFEEIFIELPRRLVHAVQRTGNRVRLLQISCVGASPLSSSARLRAIGLGEILVREASEDADKLGHFTYLNGPKFVHGSRLQSTVLRLPSLTPKVIERSSMAILDLLDDQNSIGQIQELSPDGSRCVVYPTAKSA